MKRHDVICYKLERLSDWILFSYHSLYLEFMSKPLTTANGRVVDDNQNSITAGEYGPVTLDDIHLIDKLAHFDR